MDIKNIFIDYLDQFLNYLQNIKNYSPLTTKTYQTSILKCIEKSDIYQENEVIYFNITKYRLEISSQNKRTINKKISSIKSFVKFLEDIKEQNIILKGANRVKTAQTLPKPISTEHIFEAMQKATLEHKLIVLFIYSFGLRISELHNLKLENISNNWIIVDGKGAKQRQIPSNQTLSTLLEQYKQTYNPKIYVFEDKNNKQYTQRQLQYRIEKAFKAIGIKATAHQLRHSFATDLLNNGARINDISMLLGHSSLKATGIYTKLNTNTKLKQYNMAHPLNQ